tara:strand:+ start:204 stop:452 length:249 start_codon:yes stop_codon:yes gene_type:complete
MPVRVLSTQSHQTQPDSQFSKHKMNALPDAMVPTVGAVTALARPDTDKLNQGLEAAISNTRESPLSRGSDAAIQESPCFMTI